MFLNPDNARCFPVCGACREAGVCASGPPAETTEKSSPNAGWAPNRLPLERLTCGCLAVPWPAIRALGEMADKILCDNHGWVKIARKVKKKGKPEVLGQEMLIPF
jgi:hypothetical protein